MSRARALPVGPTRRAEEERRCHRRSRGRGRPLRRPAQPAPVRVAAAERGQHGPGRQPALLPLVIQIGGDRIRLPRSSSRMPVTVTDAAGGGSVLGLYSLLIPVPSGVQQVGPRQAVSIMMSLPSHSLTRNVCSRWTSVRGEYVTERYFTTGTTSLRIQSGPTSSGGSSSGTPGDFFSYAVADELEDPPDHEEGDVQPQRHPPPGHVVHAGGMTSMTSASRHSNEADDLGEHDQQDARGPGPYTGTRASIPRPVSMIRGIPTR